MNKGKRLIAASFAQHIANVELSPDNAGIVQWVLSHTPSVDAVEVVRCKDCRYRHDSCFAGDGNTYCDKKHTYFPLDGFCCYGERRDCNA